jgi:hypothetical protein
MDMKRIFRNSDGATPVLIVSFTALLAVMIALFAIALL